MQQDNNIFLRILHRIEDIIVSILLFSILIFAVVQIILRNGFDNGIIWGDSLLRILVLWLGLVGAIVASRSDKQISIDVLSQFLMGKTKKLAEIFNNLFAGLVCLTISYFSFLFVQLEYQDAIIAFANVPAWITESIIPIGFLIMGIKYLTKMFLSNKL